MTWMLADDVPVEIGTHVRDGDGRVWTISEIGSWFVFLHRVEDGVNVMGMARLNRDQRDWGEETA